jgi:F-type H+-transporting ATPase subunit epsilon
VASFPASLVTPERTVLDTEVQAVMLRTVDGEAAFLPGHTDLIGALVPGPVRFQHEDGTEERAAVHGGFVQVRPDHVVVLAPMAEMEGEIDLDRARRALDEAQQALAELGAAGGEGEAGADLRRAELEDARRRAEVRIEVVSPGS